MVRLNPILGLNRVDPTFRSWTRTIQLPDFGLVNLTCRMGEGHSVPHGIDADVIFALTSAYEMQGRPAERMVHLSFRELCRLACLGPSVQSYARIRESLERLYETNLKFTQCWVSQGKIEHRINAQFRLIHTLIIKDERELNRNSSRFRPLDQIRVRLSDEILSSIMSGFTRSIDLELYSRMNRPLSRLLYRVLEEERELNGYRDVKVNLMSWGARLGLVEASKTVRQEIIPTSHPSRSTRGQQADFEVCVLRSNRLQRALKPAHDELVALGYLKKMEHVGSGKNQLLHYQFNEANVLDSKSLKMIDLLTERGITIGRAQNFATTLNQSDIETAVLKFDQRISEGYEPKSRPGLLVSMLIRPEDYRQVLSPISTVNSLPANEKAVFKSLVEMEVVEHPVRARSPKAAEVALVRTFDGTVDQDLKARLVAAYVAGHLSTIQLSQLTRLALPEARVEAAQLLVSAEENPPPEILPRIGDGALGRQTRG